jgi:glycosyltransferase involved in cell wall biosynthesis
MTGGIRYISCFGPSGYGNAARNYLLGLQAVGYPVTWTPLRGGFGRFPFHRAFKGRTVGDPQLDPLCNRPLTYDTVLLHQVPEYIPFWRQAEPAKRLVGYCAWETDRLPRHWPALLNQLDRLLVPCQWNRDVFRRSGVTIPVHVVPHIPDPPCADPQPLPKEIPADDFVFYTIGSWTNRKAIWNTVQCYWRAFPSGEGVHLVVKTDRRDLAAAGIAGFRASTRAALRRLRGKKSGLAPVLLFDRELSAAAMAALHARGDCYVSLCHSEGWGLGAFQACATGKPVIITGYGGQLDYLDPELSYLVDYRLTAVDDPNARLSYSSEQRWADPDLEQAARLMRHVFEHPEEAREKGKRLAALIAERFEPVRITNQLIAACLGSDR